MWAGLGQGTRTARRRRIAVLALTGIVLATAIVVAVALGNAGTQADPHKDSVVASLITELADPGSQQVNSIAFSPDGKTLATADENGRAYLWDLATRTRRLLCSCRLRCFDPQGSPEFLWRCRP
jgi:hypothetical protein